MANHEHAVDVFARLHEAHTILRRHRHGLLQQDVVSRHRWRHVQAVKSAADQGRGQLTGGKEVLPRREAAVRRQRMLVGETSAPLRIGLGHRDETHMRGMGKRCCAIGEGTATTSAD